MLPAPGQGALALEGRADDAGVRAILETIHDPSTAAAVECERAILNELDAGCRAPVAVFAEVEGDRLTCQALVVYPDGSAPAHAREHGDVRKGAKVITAIIRRLREQHADEVIASCRTKTP
jgi:hydroxymethylbilane synthase